jgi:hypothetical protein
MGMDNTLHAMMEGTSSDQVAGGTRVTVRSGPHSTMSAVIPHGQKSVIIPGDRGRSTVICRQASAIPESVGLLLEQIEATRGRTRM